jgi:hypothetical protein
MGFRRRKTWGLVVGDVSSSNLRGARSAGDSTPKSGRRDAPGTPKSGTVYYV